MERAAYLYINPKAPQDLADFLAQEFSAAVRVSALFMQEVTGGFDEAPSMADYSAVLIDEMGEIHVFEPTP